MNQAILRTGFWRVLHISRSGTGSGSWNDSWSESASGSYIKRVSSSNSWSGKLSWNIFRSRRIKGRTCRQCSNSERRSL